MYSPVNLSFLVSWRCAAHAASRLPAAVAVLGGQHTRAGTTLLSQPLCNGLHDLNFSTLSNRIA